MIDRLKDRLKSWKAKVLSYAGRATLVQSVAMAIPMYTMGSNLLTKKVCREMDSRMRDFWWGFEDNKRHL